MINLTNEPTELILKAAIENPEMGLIIGVTHPLFWDIAKTLSKYSFTVMSKHDYNDGSFGYRIKVGGMIFAMPNNILYPKPKGVFEKIAQINWQQKFEGWVEKLSGLGIELENSK